MRDGLRDAGPGDIGRVDGGESLTVSTEYLMWGYPVDEMVSPPHDSFLVTPAESAELVGWAP